MVRADAAEARAAGHCTFWLDADHVVDPPELEKSRELSDELLSDNGACGGTPVGLASTLDPP